ncbi:MAG TPA: MBL fold metallo-hydrolase [Candidatus Acidoferrales bacterium]|nr:MBL fold metallo-hydrolase [Candidatus Acidoferrales bacterium]
MTKANVNEGGLIHEIIPVGMLQCNCSIVGDPVTREAIVIDPGEEVGRILAALAKHRLTVKAIVSTHAHIDHVGGLKKLHDATGAPVLMNEGDLEMYRAMDMQAQFLGVAPPPLAKIDNLLNEGDTIRWGNYEARVLHTPGHSLGSISLYLPFSADAHEGEGKRIVLPSEPTRKSAAARDRRANTQAPWLFAGDTLFAGSIGRTDLWGGSYPEIIRSIRLKLLTLPEDTIVFPGHGPSTTLAEERETNPFLQAH